MTPKRPFRSLILLIIVPFIVSSCTAAQRTRMMVDGMKPMLDKMNSAVNKNPDVETVRRAMPASLVQLDGFLQVSPENRDILVRAAEANSGYAFLFIEENDRKRAAALYKKARDYALRVLQQNPDFNHAFNKSNDEYAAALQTLEKEDTPALLFAANSWLKWIGLSHKDNPDSEAGIPKILYMMDRMLELDDSFNYGAPHALIGAYNASWPIHLRGNPEKANYHFQRAFEISDSKFLAWKFLYAKYYAVQIQDRELFVTTLNDIISAPVDLLPEKRFANEAIKLKARRLLEKTDILFNSDNPEMAVWLYFTLGDDH